jgi:hypothetical protein
MGFRFGRFGLGSPHFQKVTNAAPAYGSSLAHSEEKDRPRFIPNTVRGSHAICSGELVLGLENNAMSDPQFWLCIAWHWHGIA